MAGTKEGAIKGKLKIIEKYGEDFYKKTGALGGKAQVKKGFGSNPELARKAGAKGGRISRRYKKTDDLGSNHSNS